MLLLLAFAPTQIKIKMGPSVRWDDGGTITPPQAAISPCSR